MYILKAFSVISALIDNTRAQVAPVGELSPTALTYAREKEYLNSGAAPGHTLVVFSSSRDGVAVQVDPIVAGGLLSVSKWIYEMASTGVFTPQMEDFRIAFVGEFGEEYTLWSNGSMVEVSNNVWMPGYIDFRPRSDNEVRYKIWYATEQFEQQFDEFEIIVTPPVDDLEVFFTGRSNVSRVLGAMTQDVILDNIHAARDGYPDTFISAEMFNWIDPVDVTAMPLPTYWSIVIYGIAGRNYDVVKEAVRNYLLDNSSHTALEWSKIFPDIFTPTEFYMVPMWGNYSVTNRVLETGLYRSVVNTQQAVNTLIRLVRGEYYTDEFIAEYAEVMSVSFKGITVSVVGGPRNRGGVFSLAQRYPDYLNVDTTSVDFGRQGPETRSFVMTLVDMLKVAEEMTPDSAVPIRFTRLVRDGVLLVACSLDGFQLIVTSKYSYEDPTVGGSNDEGEPEL